MSSVEGRKGKERKRRESGSVEGCTEYHTTSCFYIPYHLTSLPRTRSLISGNRKRAQGGLRVTSLSSI